MRWRHEALLAEGAERFAVFVGAAELANNLRIVASLLRSVGEAAGFFTAYAQAPPRRSAAQLTASRMSNARTETFSDSIHRPDD
jgi:hypothetical protein